MKPAEGSTVIGKSVTIRGELSGQEDLYLDGVLEGTVSLPENRLTVGPNARVIADLVAGDVVIYGLVEGNIRAAGRIELRDSAVVKGDIVAERLSIEENASMKGKVELSEVAARAGARTPAQTLPDLPPATSLSRNESQAMSASLAARTRPAAARRPMSASRGTPVAGANCSSACAAEESLRVLDIGATSSTNINFVTALGHSIYLANLVEDAAKREWIIPQDDGSPGRFDVEQFLATHLGFSGRGFDIVLFWDTADYLPEELLAPVLDRIHEVMAPRRTDARDVSFSAGTARQRPSRQTSAATILPTPIRSTCSGRETTPSSTPIPIARSRSFLVPSRASISS